ncbi:hypothetical protein QBC38DRAFT_455445 [Podospora fimiseda]|uniref:Uncharacterized protein n=1 Tax=Podospora fimiseda TaxID=252190 RepID=A0AAN7BPT2_9PEZI|nr:hypothetical protein QBC38DRAFT_455445 [Podospora fimiseda]
MGKMTGWLHTSEPSVQALMGHKKEVFQKAGVTPNDDPNEVSVRVRAPVGDVPENAISPIGGPAPEETLKKKRDDKRWRQGSVTSGIAESITGRSSSSGASIYAMKGSVSSGSASTGHPFDDWTQGWQ